MVEPVWEEVGADHIISRMMNNLVNGHTQICAEDGISPWDFCVMLANVQGIILGQSQDMPLEHAKERVKNLGEVVTTKMHEERAPCKGSA